MSTHKIYILKSAKKVVGGGAKGVHARASSHHKRDTRRPDRPQSIGGYRMDIENAHVCGDG